MNTNRTTYFRSPPLHCIAKGEGGTNGTLGIVAVCDWCTEHSHDAITDVLVDAAAIVLDDAIRLVEKSAEQGMDLLGIELLISTV